MSPRRAARGSVVAIGLAASVGAPGGAWADGRLTAELARTEARLEALSSRIGGADRAAAAALDADLERLSRRIDRLGGPGAGALRARADRLTRAVDGLTSDSRDRDRPEPLGRGRTRVIDTSIPEADVDPSEILGLPLVRGRVETDGTDR